MTDISTASKEARVLSSGTIGGLIHRSALGVIDRAQQEFVAFIDRMDAANGAPLFSHWQDAWACFIQTDAAYAVMLAA